MTPGRQAGRMSRGCPRATEPSRPILHLLAPAGAARAGRRLWRRQPLTSSGRWAQEAEPVGADNSLEACMRVELAEESPDVVPRRLLGDAELRGDLGGAEPVRREGPGLVLASRRVRRRLAPG